jgi:hypothetical protein
VKKLSNAFGIAVVAIMALAGTALADFSPQFNLEVSNKKVKGHPALDIHLEFDAEDEEIGNFMMDFPKGYGVASDAKVPDDEEIGSGTVTIEGGPGCNPMGEGLPTAPVTLPATIFERARTDEEIDAGVHAVWLLDLEPLNRVRLLVSGSKKTGWHIEGAPTPSDQTCNPLIVDLTINDASASGVPLVTNPRKADTYKVKAQIISQDSGAVAKFTEKIKIKK